MDARRTRASRSGAPALGQHFLSRPFATELVRRAHIAPTDLVVEIGAGTGVLTRELATRAQAVIAIELDPRLVKGLRSAFAHDPVVGVVEGDARVFPLPTEPFRVFGNIPFSIGTDLFRRLLSETSSPVSRADVVVEWGMARKRTADPPRNLLSLTWATWWTFTIERRIPAASFRPKPRVDAALLSVLPRDPPLLRPGERKRYERFLRELFRHADRPLPHAFRGVIGQAAGRVVSDVGLSHQLRPIDLRVTQAVALFRRFRITVGC